jgi:hypothetical protein
MEVPHGDGPSRARRPRPPSGPRRAPSAPPISAASRTLLSPVLLPPPAAAPPRPNKCPPPSVPTQALEPQGPTLADKHPSPWPLKRRPRCATPAPPTLRHQANKNLPSGRATRADRCRRLAPRGCGPAAPG